MPSSGTATYVFAGSSFPTRINASGITVGTLAAGTGLEVDFSGGIVKATVNTSFGTVASFIDRATISASTFSGSFVKGFFVGSSASRAGLTFIKEITAGDNVTGAIGFTKQ